MKEEKCHCGSTKHKSSEHKKKSSPKSMALKMKKIEKEESDEKE